jgi:NADPH:quinone reductase-like Zn-dependent oxidoreductase
MFVSDSQMNKIQTEMKAIIQSQYGGPEVLKLEEVNKPQPGPKEVLIKVMASSVTTADSMMMTGKPYVGRLMLGLTKPKFQTPGTGFAGIIEAIGAEVTAYQLGEEVFGESLNNFGTQAQYLCLPEDDLIMHKPTQVSFAEAAAVGDGIMTSINFLQLVTTVQPGQHVLINGAAGSLGSAAVQLAVHYGAHVTAVCSAKNLDFVKKLGAHEVIDYTKEDFTQRENQFDIIYDTVGKSSFQATKQSLTKAGIYASPVLDSKLLLTVLWTSLFGRKKAKFSATGALPLKTKRQLQATARELLSLGKVKPFISQKFKLEAFREAHSYIASGHKKGNIVFTPFQ